MIVLVCTSAHAGATEIIDFGNLAGILLLYVLGLVALGVSVFRTKRRAVVGGLLALYVMAPIIFVAVASALSHSASRQLEEQRERDRIESLEVFPRFCRERGENLPACDKYREGIAKD